MLRNRLILAGGSIVAALSLGFAFGFSHGPGSPSHEKESGGEEQSRPILKHFGFVRVTTSAEFNNPMYNRGISSAYWNAEGALANKFDEEVMEQIDALDEQSLERRLFVFLPWGRSDDSYFVIKEYPACADVPANEVPSGFWEGYTNGWADWEAEFLGLLQSAEEDYDLVEPPIIYIGSPYFQGAYGGYSLTECLEFGAPSPWCKLALDAMSNLASNHWTGPQKSGIEAAFVDGEVICEGQYKTANSWMRDRDWPNMVLWYLEDVWKGSMEMQSGDYMLILGGDEKGRDAAWAYAEAQGYHCVGDIRARPH